MREQRISIPISDEKGNDMGNLIISALDYNKSDESLAILPDGIVAENIDTKSIVDDYSPLQFVYSSDNIWFLEETEYQVLFESKFEDDKQISVLFSISNMADNFFKKLRFSFADEELSKIAGILNFRSYVGKTFLDVKIDDTLSKRIPIEVKSKKMDYLNQYSAMIADLSQYLSALIFKYDSPLYQNFEVDNNDRTISYELFMLLEFLFRDENLPSICQYMFRNLYSKLETQIEEIPTSFASDFHPQNIMDVVSNPKNLIKSDNGTTFSNALNGYLPETVNEITFYDSIDTNENRFFKYFLVYIQNIIEELLLTSKKGYIQDQLLYFNEEVDSYLSNEIFRDISDLEYIPYNSQVLQKREGYRDIFNYFLMFETSFKLAWNELFDKFEGHEKRVSELYEYWCYFKIAKTLENISGQSIDYDNLFKLSSDGWSVMLKQGHQSMSNFNFYHDGHLIDIKFYYNLKFNNNSFFESYSLAFKPDYTLLIEIDGNTNYIHFDAKYRSQLELSPYYETIEQKDAEADKRDEEEERKHIYKEGDIYKMHSYKDAILKTEGSYVLYPGNRSNIFRENDYVIPSIGAFSLIPGDNAVQDINLDSFIRKIIDCLIDSSIH